MTAKPVLAAIVFAAIACSAMSAGAEPLGPSSGFLLSYTGPQTANFEITSGEAILHGNNFEFDATFGDTVGDGVVYVWGIDRGTNIAPFGSNRSGVLFDSVVIFAPGLGLSFVDDLISNTITPLTASEVVFSGDTLKLFVPTSLLPTEGFADSNYLVNLWTRDGLDTTMFGQIAEFAPSDSDVPVTIPEPAALAMLLTGLGAMGFMMRTLRRKPASAVR